MLNTKILTKFSLSNISWYATLRSASLVALYRVVRAGLGGASWYGLGAGQVVVKLSEISLLLHYGHRIQFSCTIMTTQLLQSVVQADFIFHINIFFTKL